MLSVQETQLLVCFLSCSWWPLHLARVPFPFNLSNPPILGAPGGDCLQLPGPKTESFHAFTAENKWIFPFCSYEFLCVQPMLTNASSPATADKKHDEASVPRSHSAPPSSSAPPQCRGLTILLICAQIAGTDSTLVIG
ncbi:unnamed protein product [Miscanthus lutarioriparius]|uniref:Secreted protein n=1 Tax=Miscanthus lutarioriparius TaxID=422564 RepID=A0A811SPU2_9POAL|nr:unnamed protein product [Miscanthus lutarioriparius]